MPTRLRMFGRLPTGVGMLISTVATCMVGALLPKGPAWGLFVAGPVLMGVLLAGRAEGPAVRLLLGAREPTQHELAALGPALTLLGQRGLLPPTVDLLVRRRSPQVLAGAIGRRTVLISEGLAASCARGAVRPETTAALLAHAIGRIRLGQTRFNVATEFWMLPWRVLEQIARAVGRIGGGLPLTRLAWRIRALLGVVALIQTTAGGLALFGVAAAAVVALSYLVPWCEKRADRAAEAEADTIVLAAGLGPELAAFLTRGRPTSRVLARAHRLQDGTITAPAAHAAPRLIWGHLTEPHPPGTGGAAPLVG
ncbi:hypothetical protein [Segeticoccus rhizosphaerae]|uniref:hypothetical protein n=1 Tax=Segeticoccus rhizosphaerae TaxID=1104777 RepID=UPI0010C08717|nr:hypothetical protein [Ornithinicoccus soli]